MIVYIVTNRINGKKYIGKEVRDSPSYLGSGVLLKKAIRKYGKDNFDKKVLYRALDKKELCEKEKYFIELFNANNSDMFYNISPGGEGGKVCKSYQYREVPIYELHPITNQIIKEYKSVKEAASENGLDLRQISKVINGKTKTCRGRVFSKKHEAEKFRIPARSRSTYFSLRTGIFYFRIEEIWAAEYLSTYSINTFKIYADKHLLRDVLIEKIY